MADRKLLEKLQAQMDSICASFEPEEKASKATRQRSVDWDSGDALELDGEQTVKKGGKASYDFSSSDDAFKKLLKLVGAQDRCSHQLRERLKRDGFEEQAYETAVSRAVEIGLVDDMRYADVLVRSRIAQGKGFAGIERELLSNDIDPSDLPGWPYEYQPSEEDELQRALAILERNPPRAKNKRDAAYRKLATKGFSSSVSSSAARIWYESQCQ